MRTSSAVGRHLAHAVMVCGLISACSSSDGSAPATSIPLAVGPVASDGESMTAVRFPVGTALGPVGTHWDLNVTGLIRVGSTIESFGPPQARRALASPDGIGVVGVDGETPIIGLLSETGEWLWQAALTGPTGWAVGIGKHGALWSPGGPTIPNPNPVFRITNPSGTTVDSIVMTEPPSDAYDGSGAFFSPRSAMATRDGYIVAGSWDWNCCIRSMAEATLIAVDHQGTELWTLSLAETRSSRFSQVVTIDDPAAADTDLIIACGEFKGPGSDDAAYAGEPTCVGVGQDGVERWRTQLTTASAAPEEAMVLDLVATSSGAVVLWTDARAWQDPFRVRLGLLAPDGTLVRQDLMNSGPTDPELAGHGNTLWVTDQRATWPLALAQ